MDIRNKKVLILGGWGLVGMAIIRKLVEYKPKQVIVLSLLETQARESSASLEKDFPKIDFKAEWGNIFVCKQLKDMSRNEILNDPENRKMLIEDIMEEFTPEKLKTSFLHQVISKYKPHIIIDSINTATALAYQDIYSGYYRLKKEMNNDFSMNQVKKVYTEIEKMLSTMYIPQIIRHIQILQKSMIANKTGVYIKIGTTGTGGMGLNIPYTHSEERPSRVLLSKSSLAGAHTLLLFLMGRTPGGPICKEIKPAAAIAWKGIKYGEIHRHGQPIKLIDNAPEAAQKLGNVFDFDVKTKYQDLQKTLQSVYIDTGENGIFSLSEFEVITTAGQMEFVTPEEIAENTIMEIRGDSTGHDILNALDNAVMNPTYRAGYMRHHAINEMTRLEQKHKVKSVAFEILGPPRLSKLLYEANILREAYKTIETMMEQDPANMSAKLFELIESNQELRVHILSIGIPVLLPDGNRLLRGPEIKIPVRRGKTKIKITPKRINQWCHAGWVDLRESNMILWKTRIRNILNYVDSLPGEDSSSQHHHGMQYWDVANSFNIGKIAAWIFMNEDKGTRIKG